MECEQTEMMISSESQCEASIQDNSVDRQTMEEPVAVESDQVTGEVKLDMPLEDVKDELSTKEVEEKEHGDESPIEAAEMTQTVEESPVERPQVEIPTEEPREEVLSTEVEEKQVNEELPIETEEIEQLPTETVEEPLVEQSQNEIPTQEMTPSEPSEVAPHDSTPSDASQPMPTQEAPASPVKQELPPQATPCARKSMIPICIKREAFETPANNKANASKRLDELYQSGIKKPKQKEAPVEASTRKMTRKEYKQFLNRLKEDEEHRKVRTQKMQEEAEHQEDASLIRKSITKRELRRLTDRLAPQTPNPSKMAKENGPPPQTPSNNPNVFKRLFEQSTCKKKPICEENEEEEPVPVPQSVISSKSTNMALRRETAKITKTVGDIDECTKDQLIELMKSLSIIDNTTTKAEMKVLLKGIERCRVMGEVFSAKKLQAKLMDALGPKKHTRFDIIVSTKLSIARVNEKFHSEPEQEQEPAPEPTVAKIHKDTLERLATARRAPEPEPEPVAVAPVGISEMSKRILKNSQRTQNIQNLTMEERDKILEEKKRAMNEKLQKEIKDGEEQEMKKPVNLGVMPTFYENLPEDVKQRTQTQEHTEEMTFKPKTMSYEDFKRQQERQSSLKQTKVQGWEDSVQRMRLARIERNELSAALDPRAGPIKVTKRARYAEWKKAQKAEHQQQEEQMSEQAEAVDSILGL